MARERCVGVGWVIGREESAERRIVEEVNPRDEPGVAEVFKRNRLWD